MAASPHPILNPHADPAVAIEHRDDGVASSSVGTERTGNRSRVPWRRDLQKER
jgi:hypothetical protein